MNIEYRKSDIVEEKADALIYSTNTRLSLTGGVGLAIVNKYGYGIQTALINESDSSGMELAEIGDVLSAKTNNMPWQNLIHCVCTDGSYIASSEVIESVLKKALRICVKSKVGVVAVSELGTGYGTLVSSQFQEILNKVLNLIDTGCIERLLVCNNGNGRG